MNGWIFLTEIIFWDKVFCWPDIKAMSFEDAENKMRNKGLKNFKIIWKKIWEEEWDVKEETLQKIKNESKIKKDFVFY